VVVVEGKLTGIKNYTIFLKSCFSSPARVLGNYGYHVDKFILMAGTGVFIGRFKSMNKVYEFPCKAGCFVSNDGRYSVLHKGIYQCMDFREMCTELLFFRITGFIPKLPAGPYERTKR
jgi:hypothetical protein